MGGRVKDKKIKGAFKKAYYTYVLVGIIIIASLITLVFGCSYSLFEAVDNDGGIYNDNIKPYALVSPKNGSIINGSIQIVITFSESMDTSTLFLSGDMSSESDGGKWTADSDTDDTLTLSPSSTWTEGSNRGLTIECQDLAGNPLDTLNLSYIVDVTDPTASESPVSGTIISMSTQIVITFSESMDTNTLSLGGEMSLDSDNWIWTTDTNINDTLTISPSTTWTGGSGRGLTIDCQDLAGNPISTLNLSYTVDTSKPAATSIDPSNGSTLGESTQIVITFSESMDTNTLTLGGDMSSESDEGAWTTDTNTDDTLTISPSTTWTGGSGRGITIDCKDLVSNSLDTLNLSYSVDTEPPSASFTVSPDWGWMNVTTFNVDASASSDNLTPSEELQVRWDWENDGTWTTYSTIKTSTHTYTNTGTKTIKIELKDNVGLTSTTTQQVVLYEYLKWGSEAREVTVDSLEYVYVVDDNMNKIQKFDSLGNFILEWGSFGTGDRQFSDAQGIAVDSLNYVYVVEDWNCRIQKFDSLGNFQLKWGSSGTGDGQFDMPESVAVDSSDNVYVADTENHRIQKFTSTGDFLGWLGKDNLGEIGWHDPESNLIGQAGSGAGEFSLPRGVSIDSLGNIYVTDGHDRIQKFNSSGIYILQWGELGSGDRYFDYPYGIEVDSSENVYVADMNNNRIQKFDSSGNFILKWGNLGSGDGQFNHPHGVAVDSSGNVYVADTWNNRIQKFSMPQ